MIRQARLDDIPWLLDAGVAARAESPVYRAAPLDTEKVGRRLECFIGHPETCWAGVCGDRTGVLLGSLSHAVWFEEVWALQHLLWVSPEKRGTWRAARLVRAFEAWAAARGAHRIVSGMSSGVRDELTTRFLARMGYAHMGHVLMKEP